jgi:nucleoid-associated protein YgaU
MGKETKVGLFVIMLLLLLFGVVVIQKVRSGYETAGAGPEGGDALAKAAIETLTDPSSPDGEPDFSSDQPTIVEPEALSPTNNAGVSSVYSDGSGTAPGLGVEIPSAAEIGLATDDDHAAPPVNQLMPNPDFSAGADAFAMQSGPSLGGTTEPTGLEPPRELPPLGDPESRLPSSSRGPLPAAIGAENPVGTKAPEDNDPFGMLPSDAPERPDDTTESSGSLVLPPLEWKADDHRPAAERAQVGGPPRRSLSTPIELAQSKSGTASYEDTASAPGARYSPPSRSSQPGGGNRDRSRLVTPEVPPAIEDFVPPGDSVPVMGGGSDYVVQSGDNFWTISVKRYGTGRYFKALHLHNEQSVPDPGKLRPGMVVATPHVATLERSYPASISGSASSQAETASLPEAESGGAYRDLGGDKWYRVGSSDTLFDIAKITLGQGSQWRVIFELNRDRIEDPDRLKPGMVLRLPESARVEQVAAGPLRSLR